MDKCVLLALLLALFSVGDSFVMSTPLQLNPYDVKKSQEYAVFASVAYCPRTCLENWSCKTSAHDPLTDVSYIVFNLTQAPGYIGYSASRNAIIVSFRGSSNIQNWIENFNFEKVPYLFCLRCEVHAGFFSDYAAVEPTVNNKVQNLLNKYPTARVVTTGHSLGGALAMIAGMELKRVFYNIDVEIHHFGAPRIGNPNLARHINNRIPNIYRVVHHKDIVPHLPPDLPEFDYHHSAYEIFWDADFTEHKTCGSSGEDKSCSNQFFPDYSAADHDTYFIKMSSPQC